MPFQIPPAERSREVRKALALSLLFPSAQRHGEGHRAPVGTVRMSASCRGGVLDQRSGKSWEGASLREARDHLAESAPAIPGGSIDWLARTMKACVFFCLFCLCSLASCSKRIKDSDLVGDYVVNHGDGLEMIAIKPDGTYDYQYSGGAEKPVAHSGEWQLKETDGVPVIKFSNFLFGRQGTEAGAAGPWIVEVNQSFGKYRLFLDAEVGIFYEKKISK